jgi:hypothetical protein
VRRETKVQSGDKEGVKLLLDKIENGEIDIDNGNKEISVAASTSPKNTIQYENDQENTTNKQLLKRRRIPKEK